MYSSFTLIVFLFLMFSFKYDEVIGLPQKVKLAGGLKSHTRLPKKEVSNVITRNLVAQEVIPLTPLVKNVFSLLGPLCFIGLQMSSLSTAFTIVEKKTADKLSPIPFASLFTNCIIWTLYGFLKLDNTILIPNGLGVFVSIFCLWAYHTNTIHKPIKEYLIVALICGVCFHLVSSKQDQMIGLIGCALSVILSGSPLAVVKTVIIEKSTAALPFWTSLATWMNNVSWILYGYFVTNDKYVYLPSLLGFVLSSIQMMLFLKYPSLPLPLKDNSKIDM